MLEVLFVISIFLSLILVGATSPKLISEYETYFNKKPWLIDSYANFIIPANKVIILIRHLLKNNETHQIQNIIILGSLNLFGNLLMIFSILFIIFL